MHQYQQTFYLHTSLTTSSKPTSRTFLAVCHANDAHFMVTTDERLAVLHCTLEKPFTALTRERAVVIACNSNINSSITSGHSSNSIHQGNDVPLSLVT